MSQRNRADHAGKWQDGKKFSSRQPPRSEGINVQGRMDVSKRALFLAGMLFTREQTSGTISIPAAGASSVYDISYRSSLTTWNPLSVCLSSVMRYSRRKIITPAETADAPEIHGSRGRFTFFILPDSRLMIDFGRKFDQSSACVRVRHFWRKGSAP